jgi:hypothetical protein
MNTNRSAVFWGILLVGGGLLALAQQFGYVNLDQFAPLTWVLIFAGLGLLGLISYGLSGWQEWGWLFPTGVFGGLAVTIWMATAGVTNAAVASPLFIGLTLPFAAAYLIDRTRHWWALIPGAVMVFLTLTLLIVDTVAGEWVGALLLFMIALAFLAVYLMQRTRWWALLVAYIFGVLSVAPAMAAGGRDAAYFGPLFLFAIGLPFLVLYLRSSAQWWAIIPAGVLTTIALIAAWAIAGFIQSEREGAYASALMMGGLAATFAVLWLRHAKDWARIVTLVLAALAVASLFFVSYYQFIWPVAIILVGAYLLFSALRPKAA